MWLYDICYNIYSPDMGREIFIVRRSKYRTENRVGLHIEFPTRRWEKDIYTVVEEWHTPESQGDTGDWDYYTFMTCHDAGIFLAELAMKFNSHQQKILFQAAENLVTAITKEHKNAVREMQKEKAFVDAAAIKKKQDEIATRNKKSVYIFDMGNETVKIGISKNVAERRLTIMGHSGLFIKRACYTKAIPEHTAAAIETDCHRYFRSKNTLGEFFKVTYNEAKKYLQGHKPIFDELFEEDFS